MVLYIVLLIFIFEIVYIGIPDYVKPVFVYEYLIFFGLSYLFAIIQDFLIQAKNRYIITCCHHYEFSRHIAYFYLL